MQSLTPLFQTMTAGLHRLAEEEKAEDEKAEEERIQNEESKRRKTPASIKKRARRVTIRLASMANRCYWLSCAEVAVHILTGGDCLQSHCHQKLFTRQLQWAMQECKRHLNKESSTDEAKKQDRCGTGLMKIQVRIQEPNDVTQCNNGNRHGANECAANSATRELYQDLDAVLGHGPEEDMVAQEVIDADAEHDSQNVVATPDDHEVANEFAANSSTRELYQALDALPGHGPEEDMVAQEVIDADAQHDPQNVVATPDDHEVVNMFSLTNTANSADDYAHRGAVLLAMPYYCYTAHVRIVARGNPLPRNGQVLEFEKHYVKFKSHIQVVRLSDWNIPTIDGFQCPTWQQDPEQNSLLMELLCFPWNCTDPLKCNCTSKFTQLLSNGECENHNESVADSAATFSPYPVAKPFRKYTFQRAWRLRWSEILVLAQRADVKSESARKKLVIADTVLFSEIKEPKEKIAEGEKVKAFVRRYVKVQLRRTMAAAALQRILAFADFQSACHDEQCTLAEYCAHMVRDVVVHSQLAADARVKPRVEKRETVNDSESGEEDTKKDNRPDVSFFDMGGGGPDDIIDDTENQQAVELARFPLPENDPQVAIKIALQVATIEASHEKIKKSHVDKQLMVLHDAYAPMLGQSFALRQESRLSQAHRTDRLPIIPIEKFRQMLSMQKSSIALAKTQEAQMEDMEGHSDIRDADITDPDVAVVDLPLAQKRPAAVARYLVEDAQCTEEQITAIAGLVRDLQKAWNVRADKSTHMFIGDDVAGTSGNHRVIWLGGGGVGKTRTLKRVVEPLATTFFGSDGYLATAQSNHAAHNLGVRGRTIHSANGLLAMDSLLTAKLRLNSGAQKKMNRIAVPLGVDVVDELGIVPAPLLHADALRKTYGRSLKYKLDNTKYMQPQEAWGQVKAKILCGDFFQLPPVPHTSSLMAARSQTESYEHKQGLKLLMDIEYVVEFVNMQRFIDPLQVEVLEAMRTPGGKRITDEAWRAIDNTQINPNNKLGSVDRRLQEARGWYESAYEWRIVTYAMHVQARMDAHHAKEVLYYIPAIDHPSAFLSKFEYSCGGFLLNTRIV